MQRNNGNMGRSNVVPRPQQQQQQNSKSALIAETQTNVKSILQLPMDNLALINRLTVIQSMCVLDHALAIIHAQNLQLTEENLRRQFVMVIHQQLQTMSHMNENVLNITPADIERTIDESRKKVDAVIPARQPAVAIHGQKATVVAKKAVVVAKKEVEEVEELEESPEEGEEGYEDETEEIEEQEPVQKPVKKVTRTVSSSKLASSSASTATTRTSNKASSAKPQAGAVKKTTSTTVKKTNSTTVKKTK